MSTALNLNTQPLNTPDNYEVVDNGIHLDFAEPFAPQVEEGIRSVGVSTIRSADIVNIPNQSHAGLLAACMIYGIDGSLPTVPVLDPDQGWAMVSTFDAWDQRQSARKNRRGATGAEPSDETVLVNFGHPISDEAMGQVEDEFGEVEIRSIDVHLEIHEDLGEQFADLVNACEIGDWETAEVAVNPPTMGLAALGILAEIHGRRGSFPPVLSIRAIERGEPFLLEEVLNLDQAVETGRSIAAEHDSGRGPVTVPRELFARVKDAVDGELLAELERLE